MPVFGMFVSGDSEKPVNRVGHHKPNSMKKKLNLEKLEINSFVTNLKDNASKTVKGGSNLCSEPYCGTTDACTVDAACTWEDSDFCGGGGGGGTNPPRSRHCNMSVTCPWQKQSQATKGLALIYKLKKCFFDFRVNIYLAIPQQLSLPLSEKIAKEYP